MKTRSSLVRSRLWDAAVGLVARARTAQAVLVWACLGGLLWSAEPRVEFNRDIRPILSDKCFACHGPDAGTREADLRLDQRDEAVMDRGGYHVILPGQPEDSELIERVASDDPDLRMPPADVGDALGARELELLRSVDPPGSPLAGPLVLHPAAPPAGTSYRRHLGHQPR